MYQYKLFFFREEKKVSFWNFVFFHFFWKFFSFFWWICRFAFFPFSLDQNINKMETSWRNDFVAKQNWKKFQAKKRGRAWCGYEPRPQIWLFVSILCLKWFWRWKIFFRSIQYGFVNLKKNCSENRWFSNFNKWQNSLKND